MLVAARARRLGHAEVDDLRHRHAVVQGDEMFDGLRSRWMILLMRMLDRVADSDEEREPLDVGRFAWSQ